MPDQENLKKEMRQKLDSLQELGLLAESTKSRMNLVSDLKDQIPQWKTDTQFNRLLQIFKALGNNNRMLILYLIANGIKCPCELEYLLELSQSTISRHVNELTDAGLIKIEKSGKWSLFQPQSDSITNSPNFIINLIQYALHH